MALVQIEVPYMDSYDFGIGVDLATGSPMNKVIDSSFSPVENASGADSGFQISRIRSTAELETRLGINVEANLGCGMFGASARFGFAKDSKIQTSSLFLAVTATVRLSFESIDEPALTSAAAQVVSDTKLFSSRYGNMFVRGIRRGGLFVAVMQIDASTAEDSEAISAELEGSYLLASVDAKMKFSEITKKHQSQIHISVYHEGGPIGLTMNDPTDPNQLYQIMQKWLQSFQDDPNRNARPYYVTLAPITIANGPTPPNEADVQNAQDVLAFCAKERSSILDNLNLMDHIIQNPSRYEFAPPTTRQDILTAFQGYQADLEVVAGAASQAMNDVRKALMPAEYARQQHKTFPQGMPPMPMPTLERGLMGVYAAKGKAMADADPLVAALRQREPEGPSRRGFDMGMAVCEGQTLWGPGKQKFLESLSAAEQVGFNVASNYALQRNNNVERATKGAAIVLADPALTAARATEPAGTYWLGFDIATAIFGDPSRGAQGNTQMGPGSEQVRSTLDAEGQRGFNAAVTIHLNRHY